MGSNVFVQPVDVEVALDRRLRRGDALIVETRVAARDGELVIADSGGAACVARWTAAPELLLHPLASAVPPHLVRRDDVHVRGVVIGVRSLLL